MAGRARRRVRDRRPHDQFCRRIVNFDLPWNPMRIGQRIGRVHRIGQEHPVEVVSLCLAGSIEERILEILDQRINLFELVVGEVEMILGYLEDEREFQDMVFEAFADPTDGVRDGSFRRIGDALAGARRRYQGVNEETLEALVPEDAQRRLGLAEETRIRLRGERDGRDIDGRFGSSLLERLVRERLGRAPLAAARLPNELPRSLPAGSPVLLNAVRSGEARSERYLVCSSPALSRRFAVARLGTRNA